MTEQAFKSGFVTLIGRPNVGKSTLINRLLRQKVAAVSPRPQTTRRRQLGILTTDEYQVIFMDTPGIHKGKDRLDEYMNSTAQETILDADIVVWIVDAGVEPQPEDLMIADILKSMPRLPTLVLLLNKVDTLSEEERVARKQSYSTLVESTVISEISALRGDGQEELLAVLLSHLPEGPLYYDREQITDFYEREIAADLIRQACLEELRDEIPHGIAVRIDEYKERSDDQTYIHATIIVNRDSHKGIVIGKGGLMLKQIGTLARKEIEEMTDGRIFLELRVKTNKNWRNNPEILKYLGFALGR
jgi:GTP-binding protein Era